MPSPPQRSPRNTSTLILTGPPGSGKTTIARYLADGAERPTVHLITDSFYTAIRKGFVPPYLPESAQQNEVVIGVIVEAMLGYMLGGYDVIVDGIIGPWFLRPFEDARARTGLDISYVVLRPSLECALARAKNRHGAELKSSGPIKGLYRAFEGLGALESHVVDTTALDLDTTAKLVADCRRDSSYLL